MKGPSGDAEGEEGDGGHVVRKSVKTSHLRSLAVLVYSIEQQRIRMGLFDFLKPAPRINDLVFGAMVYSSGFATANVASPQSGKKTEVLVECGPNGPTEAQRAFFKHVVGSYPELSKKCLEAITTEFQNFKEDFQISSFDAEFELVAISISSVVDQEWSLAFTTEHDLNHHITVHFVGHESTHVLIDG